MDYQCPYCREDLGTRRRVGAIIARMEIDCPHCQGRIRLNLHPLELGVVFASFGAFAVLAALGYVLGNNALIVLALAAGMTGPALLPVIERTCLRSWVRYMPAGANTSDGRS